VYQAASRRWIDDPAVSLDPAAPRNAPEPVPTKSAPRNNARHHRSRTTPPAGFRNVRAPRPLPHRLSKSVASIMRMSELRIYHARFTPATEPLRDRAVLGSPAVPDPCGGFANPLSSAFLSIRKPAEGHPMVLPAMARMPSSCINQFATDLAKPAPLPPTGSVLRLGGRLCHD
jgi:hypothetical protein